MKTILTKICDQYYCKTWSNIPLELSDEGRSISVRWSVLRIDEIVGVPSLLTTFTAVLTPWPHGFFLICISITPSIKSFTDRTFNGDEGPFTCYRKDIYLLFKFHKFCRSRKRLYLRKEINLLSLLHVKHFNIQQQWQLNTSLRTIQVKRNCTQEKTKPWTVMLLVLWRMSTNCHLFKINIKWQKIKRPC